MDINGRQTIVMYFRKDESFQNYISSVNPDQNHDPINFMWVWKLIPKSQNL